MATKAHTTKKPVPATDKEPAHGTGTKHRAKAAKAGATQGAKARKASTRRATTTMMSLNRTIGPEPDYGMDDDR